MTDAGAEPTNDSPGSTDGAAESMDGNDDTPTVPITCPDKPVVGFATLTSSGLDGGPPQVGTTGGGARAPVTVSRWDDLMTAVSDNVPRVVEVSGMIAAPPLDGGTTGLQVKVGSNKTIVGATADSGLTGGGLFIDGSSNVIVRNLKITGAFHTDAITVQASTNVWIDHCDLSCDPAQPTACDGLVDITHASDFVTVSWTYYHDHNASGLVGHSDNNAAEDTNHLTVTYHHDLFSNVTTGPRMRFGTVHLFNVSLFPGGPGPPAPPCPTSSTSGTSPVPSTSSPSVYVKGAGWSTTCRRPSRPYCPPPPPSSWRGGLTGRTPTSPRPPTANNDNITGSTSTPRTTRYAPPRLPSP